MKHWRWTVWAALLVGLWCSSLGALDHWDQPVLTAGGGVGDLFFDGGRISWGRKNYWVSLGASLFAAKLSGYMQFKNTGTASPSSSVTGDHIDFIKDLGLTENHQIVIPEFSFNFFGRQVLRASYFSLSQNATNRLSRTFVFGGNQYTVNDDIHSSYELRELRLRYEWGLFNFYPVSLAMGFGADVAWVHGHVDDSSSGTSLDTGHRTGAVPILALRLRINFPYGLGLEANAEGIYAGLGWEARGTAGLDWQIMRYFSVQGGVQVDHLGINMEQINGVSAETRLVGGFGSATLWF